MTGGNTIQATFGIDIAPLKRGFAEAATVAKTGSAKVASTMQQSMRQASVDWQQMAAGNARTAGFISRGGAARNFKTAASYAAAPAGKYMSPAMQLAEQEATAARSILPKGLRGIGILTAVFKLESVYKQTIDEIVKMRDANEIARRPVAGGTAAGSGGLEKQLAQIGDVNKEVAKRTAIENKKGGLSEGISDVIRFVRKMTNWSLGAGNFGEQDKQEHADFVERRERAGQIVKQLGDQQRELNEIEQEGRSGSEEKAALDKADLTNRQNILEISAQQAEVGVDDKSRINAENKRFANEKEAIRNRFALKQAEVESEYRLNKLKHDGSTADEQSRAAIKERIGLIDTELSKPATRQRREQLFVRRGELTDEAADMGLNRWQEVMKNPELLEQERNRKDELARSRRQFQKAGGLLSTHRDMNGNVIGGVDPFSGQNVNTVSDPWSNGTFRQRVGMKGEPTSPAAQAALTKAEMESIMEKYWGGN